MPTESSRHEHEPEQESVWDYPRPPRVEPSTEEVTVEHLGRRIAHTTSALRVLETSHPPTYYVPLNDVLDGALQPAASRQRTLCEYKGQAAYWDLHVDGHVVRDVGWTYPRPQPGYEALADHIAFYPERLDRCTVDGEVVQAQDGSFYGGWITSRVRGPFKGAPGTLGW